MGNKRPSNRTYDKLRKDGIKTFARVEVWNPFVPPRGRFIDLYGYQDVQAVIPGKGILAIQACGRGEMPAHRRKILNECREAAMDWLKAGQFIEIYCWRELKVKRGGKATYWAVEVTPITLDMF